PPPPPSPPPPPFPYTTLFRSLKTRPLDELWDELGIEPSDDHGDLHLVGQTSWHIEHTRKAAEGLRKLDKPMLRRIRKYMDEVATLENPRDRGRRMTANQTGL